MSEARDNRGATREELGYRAPVAQAAANITYRQLDYWARTGLVKPTIDAGTGSGTPRLYSAQDVVLLAIVKRLIDLGLSVERVRALVDAREINERLAGITERLEVGDVA